MVFTESTEAIETSPSERTRMWNGGEAKKETAVVSVWVMTGTWAKRSAGSIGLYCPQCKKDRGEMRGKAAVNPQNNWKTRP